MRNLVFKLANYLANRVIPSVFLTCSLAASVAQAAPQGGSVVAGQGHISNSANITTINQYTGSMVVDWSSFNVSASETVNFNQPSSSAAALNRINDQNPSQIFGAINANGRIFLSNPNGMIFGETASVNVGSLFATGMSISNDDFMAGNYRFTSDGYTPGDIINHGTLLAASGGSISLAGGRAVNTGRIVADYGQVNLASGKTAVVSFDPAGMIGFEVSGDVEQNISGAESAVSNTGSLQSQAGRVVLEANVAADVFTYAVNNEGMISAHRINNVGGEVHLLGNDGTTVHSGHIDAYGDNGQGGSVFLLGDNVGVFEAGSIQASGDQGGGTVLIGGDWQGEGDTQTASRTYLSDESSVSADAVITGDGGKLVAWADESTLYLGHISARGGAEAGDGGQVEVSGKQALIFEGEVDLSSTNGDVGKLLLDPADIEISNAANSDITAASPFSDLTDDGDTSVLNITTLQGALNTADVTVTTTTSSGNAPLNGTITVKEAVSWSTNTLNLVADNDIVIESGANMTASGTGAMDFTAADKIDVNATLTTASSGSVSLTSGSNNGDDITFGDAGGSGAGSITTSGGAVTLKAFELVIDNTAATVIDAGASGDVIVSTSSASREINVGNDINGAGMDLSNTKLNKISASTLQIGDATHTGDIEVLDSKPVSLSKVDTVALVNNGNVIINDDLSNTKAGGSILLNADAGNDGGTGAVTAGNGDLLTAASVDLKAASGIGTVANNIHTATSTITFENTASNGVYINNTGTVSVSGSSAASTTRVTNNDNITLAAAGISSAGTARIDSTSGSINGTGTITAATADLRAATGIGNSGVLMLIVDNLMFDNSASNAVDVSNARATGVTVQGDNLGTNTTITETTGNIILHSNDISTAGIALIDSTLGSINGSGSITADSADLRAATGIGDLGDIATIADVVAFDNSGSNAVDIRNTMVTGVSVSGTNNGTGATFTESTGDITLAAANISSGGAALIDSTLGSINGSGSVNAATADLRAATGIGNSGAVSTFTDVVMFDNSGSNAVDISNTMATGVTVSGSNSGTNTTILEKIGRAHV